MTRRKISTLKWDDLVKGKECSWGTVIQCRFPLGKQRLTNYEIEQTVERLYKYKPKNIKQWWPQDFQHKKARNEEVDKIVTRLRKEIRGGVTDSQRIAKGKIKTMGVVNSFAWKGYN